MAISGTVNLNCTPVSIFPNDTSTCTIAADVSDGTVSEYTGTVKLSDNLKFVSTSAVSGWTGTSANGIFSLKTTEGKSDSFEIASFVVQMNSDSTTSGTITLQTTKLGEVASVPVQTKNINLATSTAVTDTSDGTNNEAEEDTNADIKNPSTGSSIPFMIIGCGVIGSIIVYEFVGRRKKIYKI